MTKGQEQVKEFMSLFGQECPERPTQVDFEKAKLRATLILEEAFETITKGLGLKVYLTSNNWEGDATAIEEANLKYVDFDFVKQKEVDLVELGDGLADLAYVGEFGTAVATGIDLEPIQDEVHASNMTKAWKEGELETAKQMYPDATIEEHYNGLYRLRRPDGKMIKSPSYRPADVKSIIEQQMK